MKEFLSKNVFISAMIFAGIVHAGLIFGISFSTEKPVKKDSKEQTINITLVTKKTDLIDVNTETFAQENNIGGGNKKDNKASRTVDNRESSKTQLEVDQQIQIPTERKKEKKKRVITSINGTWSINDDILKDNDKNKSMDDIIKELNLYQKELKSIPGIEDTITDEMSYSERILRLTSTTAKKKAGVLYQENWRKKVERIGNLYYPAAASKNKLYGSLRMLVIIKSDGSLEKVELLSSSGHKVLDKYALKTVKMAAPYAPFGRELKEYDKIELIRTWKFEKSSIKNY